MKAERIINKAYKGNKNFMTPMAVKYGFACDNVAYEISKGKGIMGGEIFGISLVRLLDNGNTEILHDHSKCVDSLKEAMTFVESLKNGIN